MLQTGVPFLSMLFKSWKERAKKRLQREKLHQVVKVVIPCDIHKNPPVEPAYCGPYDVIVTSFCLQSACNSLEEYSGAVSKLAKLLKPEGKLVIITMDGPGDTFFYMVGEKKFTSLSISEEALTTILQQNGFHDITFQCQPCTPELNIPPEYSDYTTKLIAIASKST